MSFYSIMLSRNDLSASIRLWLISAITSDGFTLLLHCPHKIGSASYDEEEDEGMGAVDLRMVVLRDWKREEDESFWDWMRTGGGFMIESRCWSSISMILNFGMPSKF